MRRTALYPSYDAIESLKLQNAGWYPKDTLSDSGELNACIPLNMITGFFEDYKINNTKQE